MKVRTKLKGVLEVVLIKKNPSSVVVRLPDGRVIRRKKKDVVEE